MTFKETDVALRTYDQQANNLAAQLVRTKTVDARSVERLSSVVVHNAKDLADRVIAASLLTSKK